MSGFWRWPWVAYGMTWQLAGVAWDENAHTFSQADMSGGRRRCRGMTWHFAGVAWMETHALS